MVFVTFCFSSISLKKKVFSPSFYGDLLCIDNCEGMES